MVFLEKIFVDKSYIYKKSGYKKLALFGASEIARKTRVAFSDLKFDLMFDNSANLWGEIEDNIEIKKPLELKKFKKKYFIIISTTSYNEVAKQLINMGLNAGEDFVVSPLLNNYQYISLLENLKKKIIFSSGSPPNKDKNYGGGIYQLEINANKFKVEKKISGNSYGIIRFNKNFIAIDNEHGIIEFDEDFKIIRNGKLPKNTRPHGVSYYKKTKCFYIACSNLDAVIVLDKNFKYKEKIWISTKYRRANYPVHHVNDCYVHNDSIYVSMFSETGNYVNDIYDGAVVEYDIFSKQKLGTPIKGLWMPHNICMRNEDFYLLDSLKGNLLGNNVSILGTFPSFTRGLDLKDNLFFIGQSKNRNFLKTLEIKNNNAIDCGIIVFDHKVKSSRFFQFDNRISEIHSVIVK